MKTNLRKYVLLLLISTLVSLMMTSAASAVTPKKIFLGAAELHEMLEDFLAKNKGLLPQAEVRIRSLDVHRPLELPMGRLTHEIIPSDPQILNSRRFTFIFRIDDRVVENRSFRAELEALAPVAVAAADLSRGVVLTGSDINMVEMDLARVRNPCLDPEELMGKELKRSIRLGDTIDRSQVEEPSVVNRGDLVTIVARSGGMELTATGIAREEGKMGETIKIRNASSKKEILCQVVAPGIVQVGF